jgi:hypothetical protein
MILDKPIQVTQREFIDNIYKHGYFATENYDNQIEFYKWEGEQP